MRHRAGEGHLVRHNDHRAALGGQRAHDAEHLPGELRVERRRRLVKEEHGRLHRQGARDGRPLLLAPGELRGMRVRLVGQADPGQQVAGEASGRRTGESANGARGQGDVFPHEEVGEEVELLEHHADAGAVGVQLAVPRAHAASLEADFTGVGDLEEVEAAQQRRLARAAWAQDRGDPAGPDLERDSSHRGHRAEALHDSASLEDRFSGGFASGFRLHGGGSAARGP